jgi:hypothetical protein
LGSRSGMLASYLGGLASQTANGRRAAVEQRAAGSPLRFALPSAAHSA